MATESEKGTPQGGSVSPLLANLYLFYVLDLWVHAWRQKRAHGDMIVVRYADDFIVGFEREPDAKRFLHELKERFGKFELTLHPERRGCWNWCRYAEEPRRRRKQKPPVRFNFSGISTRMWAKPEREVRGKTPNHAKNE